mgnify:CR=1 FL=1
MIVRRLISSLLIVAVVINCGVSFVVAQEDISDEIGELNQNIESKRDSINQLQRQIDSYASAIDQKQSEEATLAVEIDLLENRAAKTTLDIELTDAEIDLVNSEIRVLKTEIQGLQTQLDREQEMISDVLQQIQVLDNDLPLQTFLGTDSFSELFDEVERLETVNGDLKSAVDNAKVAREGLLERKDNEQEKRDRLVDLEGELEKEKKLLDEEQASKELLVTTVQASEAEFQLLLNQLKEEEAFINQQINLLQDEIEGKLDETDELGDSSILSWPFTPSWGISAYFHDPTYPYRHLFEHSGVDLPAPVGVTIGSAAPGYVAWTRTGRLYGNYVMVIHSNGIATLYAHMSRIDVSSGQFVTRGQSLGAVGNTGLSTGPHIHFEVRKNGIPTNPFDYLISY